MLEGGTTNVGHLARIVDSWDAKAQPPMSTRRVADLLDPANQRWTAGDRSALVPVADRVLYRALRGVLPPTEINGLRWQADLVRYEPGTLPTGELHRSLGHWNSPAQYELFETLTGTVMVLVATGPDQIVHQICGPGELAAVPPGAWHLTYVLEGPAFVFNVYADDRALPHVKFGRDDAVRCWVGHGRWGPEVRSAAGTPAGVPTKPPSTTLERLNDRSVADAFVGRDARVFEAIVADCRSV